MTYQYTKIETSIEDTSFQYISNLDDYKAMHHILDVISSEKLKQPILIGVFQKISKIMGRTISKLEKSSKDGRTIDIAKLKAYANDKSEPKIILVNNPDYNSFASYRSKYEEKDNLIKKESRTIFYNIGQLETSGSISVVPTNANVFMSSLLYAYTLLFSDFFYDRQTLDVMVNIAKIYYTIILSSFGRKSGLLVGSRQEKEMLFFLCCSFVYSIYSKTASSDKLELFLKMAASNSGSSYLQEYFHKISNINLKYESDIFNPENYDSLFHLARNAKSMGILEITESDIKIQMFRLLGVYGVLGMENYIRFVAYMISTFIPNAYFASTIKVYQKSSYEYLVEYYIKELYNI